MSWLHLPVFILLKKVEYEKEAAQKFLQPSVAGYLKEIAVKLSGTPNFSRKGIEDFLTSFAQKKEIKLKVIAQPLRVALTGKTAVLDEVMVTLGKERVVQRLQDACAYINS